MQLLDNMVRINEQLSVLLLSRVVVDWVRLVAETEIQTSAFEQKTKTKKRSITNLHQNASNLIRWV
jgi:hypothetical protein